MAQGHSTDEYLETIYFLAFPVGEYQPATKGSRTVAVRVADMLGVSRASASEMLKRLEADGLVERGEHKEAILTPEGRKLAERAVRRHRIIERLLTDFMGYTPGEAHEQADLLGDTFTDEMIERIAKQLGDPERCPHGWPVNTEFEQAENRDLSALSDLAPGTRAEIVRLAEHDGKLLHWYYDEGLVPGSDHRAARVTARGGPDHGQAERRRAGDRRASRRRPLRSRRLARPARYSKRIVTRVKPSEPRQRGEGGARVLLGPRLQARRAARCLGELALRDEVELALGTAVVREDVADRVEEPAVSVEDDSSPRGRARPGRAPRAEA